MSLHTPFHTVRARALRLDGSARDYAPLLEMAADKRLVLLGEATHGTREFYRMRAEITRALLSTGGFDALAIEGDWPDAWRVNRYVCGDAAEDDADAALGDFQRFPSWMWRNREVLEMVAWLRAHNAALPAARRAGFYGLDLYSLYRSAEAVIRYLESVDPEQAQLARQRYAMLDHVRDAQRYGYESARLRRPPARDAVVQQLTELRAHSADYLRSDGLTRQEAQFAAERNAEAVVHAEHYYRGMFGTRVNTWNLRDTHMRDALFAIAEHRAQRGGSGRVVVWAHNSHLGDARATEMQQIGECNLGQLVRERIGDAALLVGFTSYTGTVAAASQWDGEVEIKKLRPALECSYEHLFHQTRLDRFFLPLRGAEPLREFMLERAVGVIYLPQSERASHYFEASIAAQFDALFHLDETSAVEPLQPAAYRARHEPADQII